MKVYFLPNCDGRNAALVAAKNQAEACKAIGCSIYSFKESGGRRLDGARPVEHLAMEIAATSPGTVFYQRIMPVYGAANPWRTQRYSQRDHGTVEVSS